MDEAAKLDKVIRQAHETGVKLEATGLKIEAHIKMFHAACQTGDDKEQEELRAKIHNLVDSQLDMTRALYYDAMSIMGKPGSR